MFLTEYDQEKVLEKGREEAKQEGREEGRVEGRQEGIQEGRQIEREKRNVEVATDMIKEGNQPVSLISKISKLSESSVRKLATQLGITTL